MNGQDITIFGVSSIASIIGVVTLFKEAGVPGRFAPLLAAVLGLGAGFAAFFSGALPAVSGPGEYLQAGVVGIGLGLSAAKSFEFAGTLGTKIADKVAEKQPVATSPPNYPLPPAG